MNERARVPRLILVAMAAATAGALLSLALFLRAGPYTLVAFMFLAQPLLAAAALLLAVQVFKDLRQRRVL